MNYTKIADDFLQKEFNINLKIPIEINGRLSKTLGRYIYRGNRPLKIELSKKLLEYYDKDTIIDVLKHELVHYALHKMGVKGFGDGDADFENTLKILDVNRTGVIKNKGKVHKYECGCGCEFISDRKLMKKYKYSCRKHNSELQYKGEVIIWKNMIMST